MNEKIEDEELELNAEQVERVDEIHNSVMELCRVMCEEPDLEWDMEFIGEIADLAADVLTRYGKKVRYPAVMTDVDGTQRIEEYYG